MSKLMLIILTRGIKELPRVKQIIKTLKLSIVRRIQILQ
jgi:hypothetical protein